MNNQFPLEALRDSFAAEARELLAELELVLIDMEEHPDDPDLTDRAFRALHSIKGSGGMFGYQAMSDFVHEIEDVFDRVRKGDLSVDRNLIDATLAARDILLGMIESDSPQDGAISTEADGVLEYFRSIMERVDESQSDIDSAPHACMDDLDGGIRRFDISFTPPPDLLKRGTDPIMILDQLRSLGPCSVRAETAAIPLLEDLNPDDCYLSWTITVETDRDLQAIRDVFLFVEDNGGVTIEPRKPAVAVEARDTGDETDGSAAARIDPVALAVDTIRVPSSRLDTLIDLVGELVTVQASLSGQASHSASPELLNISETIERLTDELRDTAMNLRMVPIGTTFTRFRRLVRDLSQQLDKEVNLETVGDETELDKTVIEKLADPLVHIIRNAIDHGLETAVRRRENGKPEVGTIRLRAAHEGASVVVEVSDDGSGLDLERIRRRAEEKGLVAPDAILGDAELSNLIFAPGFSTTEQVTDVSGRGVGMDVVRKTIDSLGGSIETTTERGQGMTVRLRLPLTLAIIDGLLVRLRDAHYVLPLSAVSELIEYKRDDSVGRPERRLVEIRGSMLPVIDLAAQFRSGGAAREVQKIVIVDWKNTRVGLLVDDVLGQQQTVIKNLGAVTRRVDGVSGATILGDGSVALILDVPRIISNDMRSTDLDFDKAAVG